MAYDELFVKLSLRLDTFHALATHPGNFDDMFPVLCLVADVEAAIRARFGDAVESIGVFRGTVKGPEVGLVLRPAWHGGPLSATY